VPHLSKTLTLIAILVVIQLPGTGQAADPSLRWRTITTPNFYVHYYRSDRHNERKVAQQVARAAETAHARLVPLWRHRPASRVHIVVTDDTDGANGSAQIVPMNVIRVFVTGPDPRGSLNDYDNWIYGLLLHEYSHILHIDNISGIARFVNMILGKSWAPNQVQPRWITEGFAVYGETSRSAGGRGRGTIYDMYLRAAVLEKRLLRIDQISSSTRLYPRGTVPYLYGARFIKYVVDRYGEARLGKISSDYGGAAIPYAINRVAKRVLGRSFVELYGDFRKHLQRRYALQAAAARRRGLTTFRKLTNDGWSCDSPRLSRDGKELVFADSDGHSHGAYKILDLRSGKIGERYEAYGGSGVGFTPDGRYLVHGQSAPWRTVYGYNDIYVRERSTGKSRRLTTGLRAKDPAVSPDGSKVAFVTNELGTTSLALIPFDGGKHRMLLKSASGDQISTPRWSPDGQRLVFSRWREGGHRDIQLLDLASGRVRAITADRAIDLDPVFSPDGTKIYFSSDRTGIYNVFVHELASRELQQVTNVLGGAFTPVVSRDSQSLYYVGYSARGFDLHAMPLRPVAFKKALPYVNDRPKPTKLDQPKEPYPEAPYSPLPTVYPRSWALAWGSDADGTQLGFELIGGDVVGRHRYAISTSVHTVHGRPSYALSYLYNRLWPSLRFNNSRFEGPRGGVLIDGKKSVYIEENYGFGVSIGLPVLRVPEHSGDITLGYALNWFRDADETSVVVMPGELTPRLPEVGVLAGATLRLSYRSTQRYAYSISTERGRAISLALRIDHPRLGSDFESTQLTYSWAEYIDLPWADEHVLALRLGGGVAAGNLKRRGIFFVGGFPEQDLLRSLLLDHTRLGGVHLRGYAPGVVYGDQYHLLNVEYRLPLFDIERGLSTLPLYLTHVHAAVFVDAGNAFFGDPVIEDFKVGVGAELLVEAVVGHILPATFRVGYARGLMDPGGNEFHFLLGNKF
jgi:hypothetical protein